MKREVTVLDKVYRKRRLRPGYGLDDVRDLIGIRFVTLLRMDIAQVVEGILSLLAREGGKEPADFGTASFLEFKQFIANPPPAIDPETGEWVDPLRDKLKTLLPHHFPRGAPVKFEEEIRAQYSGVHVILAFPIEIEGHPLVIPAELQIRSVFEDAWGEIDHKLFYEADRAGLVTGQQQRLAASRHLGILKAMLDTAADYAEVISELDLGGSEEPKPDINLNLDGAEYVANLTVGLVEHRDLLDEFVGLVREKERTDKAPNPNEYVGLADKFANLFNRFNMIDLGKFPAEQQNRVVSVAFLILMEEALCRFLGASRAHVERAVNLYARIIGGRPFRPIRRNFQNYPTAWFRLAQAKAWLIELTTDPVQWEQLAKEAFSAYARARKGLGAVPADADLVISPGQRNYLDGNIERLQGFALWRLSDLRRRSSGAIERIDLENLRDAWKVVERVAKALDGPLTSDELNLLNTAVFVALDGLHLCETLGEKPFGFPGKRILVRMLDTLEEQLKLQPHQDEKAWHTIMRGAQYLSDTTRAITAAREVMRAHVHEDVTNFSPYQKEIHDRAALEAWSILDEAPKND